MVWFLLRWIVWANFEAVFSAWADHRSLAALPRELKCFSALSHAIWPSIEILLPLQHLNAHVP